MGKAFGILLLVVGMWVSFELYLHGIQGAFGGVLVSLGASAEQEGAGDPRPVPQRAGDAVERAHAEAQARFDSMLDE
jgi:hypothetical protein